MAIYEKIFTTRKRCCTKVVFLHRSVILFTGGACVVVGACMGGGKHDGGMCGRGGVCGWGGSCMAESCMQERRPLKQVVRILLECILVWKCSQNYLSKVRLNIISHTNYLRISQKSVLSLKGVKTPEILQQTELNIQSEYQVENRKKHHVKSEILQDIFLYNKKVKIKDWIGNSVLLHDFSEFREFL